MPDNINELLNLLPQSALASVGPLPFFAPPASPSSAPVPSVDVDTIGAAVLGFSPHLDNRAELIAALTTKFPIAKKVDGKVVPVLTITKPIESIGPMATVVAAAQMLSTQASTLTGIRPFDSCAGDGCGIDKLVSLVQANAGELLQALSRPGRHSARQVNYALSTLCGYDPDACVPFDPSDVCGYLGDLRDHAGLVLKKACTTEQEKMLTRYRTVVQLANIVVQTWESERRLWMGEQYLGVSVYELRRLFWALSTNLQQLWTLIPAAAWATTSLPVDPPVLAIDFWRWCNRFVTNDAPAQLEQVGKPALFAIKAAMREFANVFEDGFLNAKKRKRGGYGNANDCSQLPSAFHRRKVTELVREMLCDVQRVVALVQEVSDSTSYGYAKRMPVTKAYSAPAPPQQQQKPVTPSPAPPSPPVLSAGYPQTYPPNANPPNAQKPPGKNKARNNNPQP